MPHGTIRLGDVEILALCDAVVLSSESIEASYPLVPHEAWAGIKDRYPGTVAPSGRWRLHVHCYVARTPGRTVLFDTGIGPATAPANAWAGVGGRLDAELEAAGVSPATVDDVVISHAHDDHVGWNVADDSALRFPNARYLMHRADIDAVRNGDEEDRAIWERTLEPLGDALVGSSDGMALGDGLSLVHLPGHTPGHQVLFVESAGERAVLSADITNHELLLEDPSWSGTSDGDPDLAARTRRDFLDRVEREDLLYVPSHFEEPFGRIRAVGGRRRFERL